MEADAVLREAAQRMVQRLDPDHDELPVVFDRRLGIYHVPARRGRRIVELEDEPGIEDCPVFLAHRLGAGIEEVLVALVKGVWDAVRAAWGDGGHEPLLDP